MKHCKYCNVDVDTNESYCPLCYNSLEGDTKKQTTEFYLKRTEDDKTQKTNFFLYKLFFMITLVISAIVVFINVLTYKDAPIPWSAIVIVCLLYVWVLIAHTILSKRGIFEKILLQVLAAIAIVGGVNYISKGHWLTDYVVPSIQLAVTVTILFVSVVTKSKYKIVSPFFVTHFLSFIASLVLVLTKADAFGLLSEINMIACGVGIVGTLLFGFKILKSDFAKKFHL